MLMFDIVSCVMKYRAHAPAEPPNMVFCNPRFEEIELEEKVKDKRGSSEYSENSYQDYQLGEPSPDASPMQYRPRSLTPPSDHVKPEYIPHPEPLSETELSRLPVVKLQGKELMCYCAEPWKKDEEATLLLCGHKLHQHCAGELMKTGICPICKTCDVIDDKLREIRINLSEFNFN